MKHFFFFLSDLERNLFRWLFLVNALIIKNGK